MTDWREPIHPGEILADELAEIGLNASQLAQKICVPENRIFPWIMEREGVNE